MSSTNIYFYNYCGTLANHSQIINSIMLAKIKIDILMISETSLDKDDPKSNILLKNLNFHNYSCYLSNASKGNGTAIIINKSTIKNYKIIAIQPRYCIILLPLNNKNLLLINNYGPQSKSDAKTKETHYENIKKTILENTKDNDYIIFGGDHNTVVNPTDRSSHKLDSNSKYLKDIINTLKLKDLHETSNNHQSVHTFHRNNLSSRIDSIWHNNNVTNRISNFQYILDGLWISDHIPLLVQIKHSSNPQIIPNIRASTYKFPRFDHKD